MKIKTKQYDVFVIDDDPEVRSAVVDHSPFLKPCISRYLNIH